MRIAYAENRRAIRSCAGAVASTSPLNGRARVRSWQFSQVIGPGPEQVVEDMAKTSLDTSISPTMTGISTCQSSVTRQGVRSGFEGLPLRGQGSRRYRSVGRRPASRGLVGMLGAMTLGMSQDHALASDDEWSIGARLCDAALRGLKADAGNRGRGWISAGVCPFAIC